MNTKWFPVLSLYVLYTVTVHCQKVTVSSNCGLFSPHQVDIADYLKNDSDDSAEFSDVNLEVANIRKDKKMNIDLLIDISPSSEPVRRKPLNLCFALDRSASMEENSRMEKLKAAMKEMLSYLVPGDYLSIVTYDDVAQVILSSRQYSTANDSVFREIIDRITIGGGTNMLAGMLKGYDEINKNHNRFYRNRLILMSDGVSTAGERDPVRILKHTVNNSNKGIETSTIGIGNNINFALLHDISVEGKGQSHFVGDCDSAYIDIEYVLREEFYNMNASMEDIRIDILYPKYYRIVDVYGASKIVPTEEKLTVSSSNLAQKNQFILIKFQSGRRNKKDKLTVNVNFTENGEQKYIEKHITQTGGNFSSEKMLLANKIIDAVNCVKHRLSDRQYSLDCLERFVNEPNVPGNIVLLRRLIQESIR
jgi:Mg-chelatase subunit ChlD